MKVTLKRLFSVLLVLCMMLSVLPVSALAKGGGGSATYNHIDVRVDGTLVITEKVNDVVVSSQTISIKVTSVTGTLNGEDLTGFYYKPGEGTENEWRCDDLELDPKNDTVVINCTFEYTVDGVTKEGSFTRTYTESVLNDFIQNCPGKNGYDIDFEADQLTEMFSSKVGFFTEYGGTIDGGTDSIIKSGLIVGTAFPSIPTTAAYEGYEFAGWYPADSSGNATSGTPIITFPTTVPENDVYYVAKWKAVTTISGSKTWVDGDNAETRPTSITIRVMNGEEEAASKTVTANDNWSWTFTLPALESGSYTIKEDPVPGYQSTVSGYDVTNTLTTTISGSKTWIDNGNQDGKRPGSIQITLMKDNDPVETKNVTAEDNWAWSFTVPKYENGVEIQYSIVEAEVEGYTTDVKGYNVTNTHTPETIKEITVTKVWDDNKNQDGKQPTSVEVQLYADNEPVEGTKATLNAENNWTHTWENLDKYKAGKEIVYSVQEVTVPGYSAEVTGSVKDGFTVTNTHIPETIEKITVTKEWDDNKNQDGKRPTSVEVQLYADNEPVEGTKATLNAENNWTHTWEKLDKYKAGEEIVYSVQEVTVPDGYAANITGSAKEGFTVTNTHTPETIEKITVTKEWDDNNNQDDKQPAFVEVQLYANDEPVDSGIVTLNETNGWSSGWENVPKYEDGVEIAYKVVELTEVEGYTTEITGDVENGFIVKNSHTPETVTISGEKTWEGDEDIMLGSPRPESITVYLADGNNNVVAEQTVTPDKETGRWTYCFENVPKYANGELIQYKILEKKVPGYTYSAAGNGSDSIENSYDIINTYNSELISITVTKSWVDGDDQDGIRPDSVEVQLKGNGKPVGESVALNADNQWSYTFAVDKDYQGKEIKYTVEEVNVPRGYTPVVNTEDYGFSITNTHVPEVTSVSVQKVWNDENDLAGYRPESVQVQLYKTVNNQTVPYGEAVTLNEDVRWKHEWTNLPVKEAGEAITYSVSEVEVPDHYDAAISVRAGNVFVLTNTHDPAKTNITVTKTWDDGNDRDGLRPSSVKVTLYRNGTKVKTVTLSERNDWTYTFENMQVYADGEKANYTVTETKVDNYQPKVTYTENPNTGLAIELVNSYTPEQTSVTVTKKWTDSSNKYGDRPNSVTIYLLANGEKTGDELVLNSANKWTGSFDNLPVKKDGKTIKYTVSEKSVAYYTAKITGSAAKGFVVTNTHTSIPVTGDESNLVLYAVLFAIGAAAVASALILSKKKFGRRR